MTGHIWRLNALGERHDDAIDYQSDGIWHNGPICTVCDFGYCMWCPEPEGLNDCPGPPSPVHVAEYFEDFEPDPPEPARLPGADQQAPTQT